VESGEITKKTAVREKKTLWGGHKGGDFELPKKLVRRGLGATI